MLSTNILEEIQSHGDAPLQEEVHDRIQAFKDDQTSPDSIEKARKFMGELLQDVLKLEFFTVPLYLNAGYSLVQKHNQIFKLLIRVALEEMSHMTVVANLMIAIDVQPKFAGDHAPQFPGALPLVQRDGKPVTAKLRSFRGTNHPKTPPAEAKKINEEVIGFFKQIELPHYPVKEDTFAERLPSRPAPKTIGELYEWLIDIWDDPQYPSIRKLLDGAKKRTAKQQELRQIPEEGVNDMRYHPVRLYPDKGAVDYTFDREDESGTFDMIISSVETAKRYLTWISREGEGASAKDPWALSGLGAHYFRFDSTLKGRQFVPREGAEGGEYEGSELNWELDKICTFDDELVLTNYSEKTQKLMKEFDIIYSKMLKDLERSYEEVGDSKRAYYRRATRVWMKELGLAARRLIRHMVEENKPIGQRGGLSFIFRPEADPGPLS